MVMWKRLENLEKWSGRKPAEKAAIKWLSKESQNFIKELERKAAKIRKQK
jgi:hypothetical protein